MKAHSIENIVFDLGGVLLNLDFNKTEKAFVDAGIGDFKKYFALGHAAGIFSKYETGDISDEEFLEGIVEISGNRVNREMALNAWNAMLLDFPPERIELLKELASRKRIFLYSNTNAIHYTFFSTKFAQEFGSPLDRFFEKTYYSHLIGHRKPDTGGFDFITKDAAIDPANTLFIDDALVNIEGARKAGWQAYWLEPGQKITDARLEPYWI